MTSLHTAALLASLAASGPETAMNKTPDRIHGIHHITAIASDPQRNVDFYVAALGLRLVKRTVNFDDPGTYHLYYGDQVGSPGTILTFFPWAGAKRGTPGVGQQTATAFVVPVGSIDAWHARLTHIAASSGGGGVSVLGRETRFGQKVLRFEDHDGMSLELIETPDAAAMPYWTDGPTDAAMAIRGFHSATLTVRSLEPTAKLLTETLGFTLQGEERGRTRFVAAGTAGASIGQFVDVVVDASGREGTLGAGIIHHLALRATDDAQQERWQTKLYEARHGVTDVRDRNYFHSIYFREPGGVLFEIATDNPGFAVDEPVEALGMGLKLPSQYERGRGKLELSLRPLTVPSFKQTKPDADFDLYLHRFDAQPNATRTLILLHGTGGNERDLLPLGRMIDANANLLSPLGNVTEGSGPNAAHRFFRRLSEGVFDLEDVRRRTAELSRWFSAAVSRYAIKPETAAFVGFSNGANTAAAMLLSGQAGNVKQAVLIRAMVTIEPTPGVDLTGTKVLLLSGREDHIVPVENAKRLAAMLTKAGATVEHKVLETGHSLTKQDVDLATAWIGKP